MAGNYIAMEETGNSVDRPLDALNAAREKKVVVEIKGGRTFTGVLKSFDIHINVVMDDASELVDGEIKRKLGRTLIRGDSIILVSPEV